MSYSDHRFNGLWPFMPRVMVERLAPDAQTLHPENPGTAGGVNIAGAQSNAFIGHPGAFFLPPSVQKSENPPRITPRRVF
jgi:hypothetical protein